MFPQSNTLDEDPSSQVETFSPLTNAEDFEKLDDVTKIAFPVKNSHLIRLRAYLPLSHLMKLYQIGIKIHNVCGHVTSVCNTSETPFGTFYETLLAFYETLLELTHGVKK